MGVSVDSTIIGSAVNRFCFNPRMGVSVDNSVPYCLDESQICFNPRMGVSVDYLNGKISVQLQMLQSPHGCKCRLCIQIVLCFWILVSIPAWV